MTSALRACIIGSGNWGSTIGKIVATNVRRYEDFATEVKMWVFDEKINGRNLSQIINEDHENVKYLAGIQLPDNLVAVTDIKSVVSDADILLFVTPHQFLRKTCTSMRGCVKSDAFGVSFVKGVDLPKKGGMGLLTDAITEILNIPCGALMGANLAPEVAQEMYSEATIGCHEQVHAYQIKRLIQTDYFRLSCTPDQVSVELCGALKNIVATGAGVADGLGYKENTKAAVIRLGLMEMIAFIQHFFGDKGVSRDTLLESCGIADLITTSYGGRNRLIGQELARTREPLVKLEARLLHGQSAQGPLTAAEVNALLRERGLEDAYPIFTSVHRMCEGSLPPDEFIACLRSHPAHVEKGALWQ